MNARSYLFVPASRPDRFAKALASGADAVIVDLEDAVPPDGKEDARAQLADWLQSHPQARVQVRVNGADSPWFAHDLAACRAPAVVGIVVPKAERAADLSEAGRAAPGRVLLPMIESALGYEQAGALARVPGVQRLAFGSVDFQYDLGIEGDGEELLHYRCGLVLQSRLAGLDAPVDGVTIDIDDEAQLALETHRARRLGFSAKLCIHPTQVAAVHSAFMPHADELAWARRVVRAAAQAHGAVLSVDGKMVDRPVILRARAVLARAPSDDADAA